MKYVFIFLFFSINAIAQNLVPNGDFELYISCPNYPGQIDSAINWLNPNLSAGTPDYCNACDLSNQAGVPSNYAGYRNAHSGVGYGMIVVWTGISNAREYIESELTSPLLAEEEYCISFYVALAQIGKMGCDGIGVLFTDTLFLYNGPTYPVLPYQPQIENPSGNIITDTVNWTLIQQTYVAIGGEQFITIGNFRNDSMTNVSIVYPNSQNLVSAFYIDDVSITPGACITGIEQLNAQKRSRVYPNPSNGVIHINHATDAKIELFDISGRLKQKFNSEKQIDLTGYKPGVYVIKISRNTGLAECHKIILLK